ncbi:MAG: hypothetical protein ACOCXQ_03630 [Patescibacteria group bacterium]
MYLITQQQVAFNQFDLAANRLLQCADQIPQLLQEIWSDRALAESENGFLFNETILSYQILSASTRRVSLYFTTENTHGVIVVMQGIDETTVEVTLYAEDLNLDTGIFDLIWGSDSEGLQKLLLDLLSQHSSPDDNGGYEQGDSERAVGDGS